MQTIAQLMKRELTSYLWVNTTYTLYDTINTFTLHIKAKQSEHTLFSAIHGLCYQVVQESPFSQNTFQKQQSISHLACAASKMASLFKGNPHTHMVLYML